jgi:inosine triphosphate pyrophosphatase
MVKVTLVTGNDKKWAEIQTILAGSTVELERVDIDLPELQGADAAEVAEAKCREACRKLGGRAVIIEDTSLAFDAFGGNFPGPYIKWFLADMGTDGLCQMLSSFQNRKAKAVCTFAYTCGIPDCAKDAVGSNDPRYCEIKVEIFQGITEGSIALSPKNPLGGEKPFGWDPIFIPDDQDSYNSSKEFLSYAQMSSLEKNKISHRRRGLDKLAKFFLSLQSNESN